MVLAELVVFKTFVVVVLLVILYSFESLVPFYQDRKERLQHNARSIAIAVFNAVIVAVLFSAATLAISQSAIVQKYGLLNLLGLPVLITTILAIILFDFWMYWWHVMNHKIPFLWKFHKMHHSDTQVDASTAFRFHPGEILIFAALRLVLVAVLGLALWQVLIYEILLLPVIMFHHSNVNIPKRVDRIYRLFFASPYMHRIHHSDVQNERDTNYTSIFSIWDRLFKTYRMQEGIESIEQGVSELKEPKWNTLKGLFKTPFAKR